jgi:hypothetical protein
MATGEVTEVGTDDRMCGEDMCTVCLGKQGLEGLSDGA